MRSGMIKIGILAALGIAGGVDDWSVDGRDAAGGVDDSDGSGVGASSKGRAIDGAGGTLPGKALTV